MDGHFANEIAGRDGGSDQCEGGFISSYMTMLSIDAYNVR